MDDKRRAEIEALLVGHQQRMDSGLFVYDLTPLDKQSETIIRELLAEIDRLTHENKRLNDVDDYDPLARDRKYWGYLQRLYALAARRDGFVGTPEQINLRYQRGTLPMHEERSGLSQAELVALRDECGWFPTPRDIETLYG